MEVLISETPVNLGQNQIMIQSVLRSPAKPKITILFENKKRIDVQISLNNVVQHLIKFVMYSTNNIIYISETKIFTNDFVK